MMIDLDKEAPILLADFGKLVKKHYNTVHRWWRRGLKVDPNDPDSPTVKIETVRISNGRATTVAAYDRFLAKLNEDAQ
jgi:hypothetical protein